MDLVVLWRSNEENPSGRLHFLVIFGDVVFTNNHFHE